MMIILVLAVQFARGDSSTSAAPTEQPTKPITKGPNSIPIIVPKAPTYYVPQHSPPYVQYIQKPVFLPHQQPQATMLIIAQPALVPQHLVYGPAAQQLLHYFHTNPQARYNLLHAAFQPHPTVQTYAQPQHYPQPSPPQNYQIIPSPQHLLPAAPQPQPQHQPQPQLQPQAYTPVQYNQQQHPTDLQQISHYANLAAQQYAGTPIKTAPPIITGFENFTPEQQAQIKQQLGAHFGTNLTPINGNSLQAGPQFGAKFSTDYAQQEQKQEPHQQQPTASTANYGSSTNVYSTKQYSKA
ncbi:PREDICTED: protein transport protein SEC24-like [Nicrophorus vespilloides]|uniref:Protein transport protein SEC24-like n=1 Tax=Nicrophorus vespilloides TaxID=110193 RepID=A0ABM1MGP8_NICVS|nr:PREDICTED: protein transport protein SEC24-like [Nicrophorus vespilloides]